MQGCVSKTRLQMFSKFTFLECSLMQDKLIFSWLAGIYRDDCTKTEESKGWLGGHIWFATKEVVHNFGHWNVPWNVNRVYSTFEVDSSWVARDLENSYHHCAHSNQANVSRGRWYDLSLQHLQKCICCLVLFLIFLNSRTHWSGEKLTTKGLVNLMVNLMSHNFMIFKAICWGLQIRWR